MKTALSIQAHPDRQMAEKLHVQFPDIYKDPNPKPEIAISLTDDFEACFGFADEETIHQNFGQNPILLTLQSEFGLDQQSDKSEWLKKYVHNLFF